MEILLVLLIAGLVSAVLRIRALSRSVESMGQKLEELGVRVAQLSAPADDSPVAAPPVHGQSRPDSAHHVPGPTREAAEPHGRFPPPERASPVPPAPVLVEQSPERVPQGPSGFDRAMAHVAGYFTGGNLVVRVGVIVLFFGVAFLLQYANAQGVFDVPIEVRLVAVALLGLTLLVLGWLLRHRRRTYGLILQGGGLGMTYITVFAAMQLYDVVPAGIALAILVILVALGGALAVLQNSSTLAVVAVIGGFLAPLITSTGEGSHVSLFSYYLVLNVGILGIAWFRSWRALNLLGFLFTFVIATLWGVLQYRPQDGPSVQVFLILFFLFYVAVAVLYASRQPPHLRGVIDTTLIFGVPLVAFGLQAGLVARTEYGLAISALVLGVFYAALRQLCRVVGGPAYLLLSRAFLALGLAFASLSIPLAFDGEWVATAWAIEGAAVLWIALIQRSRLTVLFALALQGLAGLLYLPVAAFDRFASLPVFNAVFLGGFLLALAGFVSSWLLRRAVTDGGYASVWRLVSWAMAGWGLAWWLGNGVLEIFDHVEGPLAGVLTMVFLAFTAVLLGVLEVALGWDEWRFTAAGLLVAAFMAVVPVSFDRQHPFADGFGWGWLALFAALYALLWIRDARRPVPALLLRSLHTGVWWLAAVLLTLEGVWLLDQVTLPERQWLALAGPLVLAPMVWAAMRMPGWPLARHRRTYLGWGSALLVAGLVVWSLLISPLWSATFEPLPYLPFLNPLDLVQGVVLVLLVAWWRQVRAAVLMRVPLRYGWVVACALTFVWLSAVLLRTLHHWTGVDYTAEALWGSDVAQAAISILWTLIALTAMVLATKRGWRRVWVAAASILGVVVVKLFVVDMRGSDTLGSIIAFIAVGVLLLLAGYLSPLPPKRVPDPDGSGEPDRVGPE